MGPLPTTEEGNRWLLIAVDHTTKWPVVKSVPQASNDIVAKFLHEEIVMRFGCPTEIITDRAPNFTTATLRAYMRTLGVKHVLTSAYHPRSNGVVERFNRLFGGMLSRYVGDSNVNQWDLFVDRALFACRVRVHRSTGQTPFYMVYGVEPRLPGDPLHPFISDEDNTQSDTEQRQQQLDQLAQTRLNVHERLGKNALDMKNYYDRQLATNQKPIEEGDWVLLHNQQRKKFKPHWIGPFKVHRQCPFGTFQLEDVHGSIKPDLVHRDLLKRAYVDITPSQCGSNNVGHYDNIDISLGWESVRRTRDTHESKERREENLISVGQRERSERACKRCCLDCFQIK
jgi:hypothetical protein